jgi:hypothetical protein
VGGLDRSCIVRESIVAMDSVVTGKAKGKRSNGVERRCLRGFVGKGALSAASDVAGYDTAESARVRPVTYAEGPHSAGWALTGSDIRVPGHQALDPRQACPHVAGPRTIGESTDVVCRLKAFCRGF